MSRARLSTLVTVAAIAATTTPSTADAQRVLTRIKEQASKRFEERKAQLDSTVLKTASETVDSMLEKTGRGAEAVVNKAASVADTTLNRTERGISNLGKGGDEGDDLRAELATGRAVVPGIEFAPGSPQLLPSSESAVSRLAKVIQAASGPYVIEAHTDSVGGAAASQALSEQRAAAVKAALVAAGVPAARLFAMGLGTSRPMASGGGGTASNARVEIARMQ